MKDFLQLRCIQLDSYHLKGNDINRLSAILKYLNSKKYTLSFYIDVEHYLHRHHVKQINVRVFMRNLVIPVMQTIHK